MPYKALLKMVVFSFCLLLVLCIYAYMGPANVLYPQSEAREERPQDGTVAVVNGRKINKSEVDGPMASQIQSLEQKIYELRSRSLEALVNRILFEEEAGRRGVGIEELRRQIVAGVKVEEKEVEAAYSESLSRYGPPPVSELDARERIRATLEAQKRSEALNRTIGELKTRSKIDIYLKAPEPLKVEISNLGPSLGAEDAPVTIAEFSDFQCQYCKQVNNTLKQIVESYGGKVRVVYKNMPLPNHPQAFRAAQAANCAAAQGKFWQYHDLLFEHSGDLSENTLRSQAAEAGLDMKGFDSCLGSDASRQTVMKDLQEAKQAGIYSTPTFVINGRVLRGTRDLADFKAIIDQSLKEQKAQRPAPAK